MLGGVAAGALTALRGIKLAARDPGVVRTYKRFFRAFAAIAVVLYALSTLVLAAGSLAVLFAFPAIALVGLAALLFGALRLWLGEARTEAAVDAAVDAERSALREWVSFAHGLGGVLGLWPSCAFFLASILAATPAVEFVLLGVEAADGGETRARRLRVERRALPTLRATLATLVHAVCAAMAVGAARGLAGEARPRAAAALSLCVSALSTGVQCVRVHLASLRAVGLGQQLRLCARAAPQLLGFGLVLQLLMSVPLLGPLAGLGVGSYAAGCLLCTPAFGDAWLFASPPPPAAGKKPAVAAAGSAAAAPPRPHAAAAAAAAASGLAAAATPTPPSGLAAGGQHADLKKQR